MYKKKFNILVVFLVLFSLLSCNVKESNKGYTVDNLPITHLKDSTRYFINPDGIVSSEIQDSVDFYLRKLKNQGDVETIFAFVNKVNCPDNLAEFCANLGNKYGVGNKKTDRGLIIIIANDQHRWFIAPGKGLESELTDIDCNNIGKKYIVYNMKAENPDAAALETVKAVYTKLTTGKEYNTKKNEWTTTDIVVLILVIVFIFSIVVVIGINNEGGGYSGGLFSSGGSGSGGSFGGGSFGCGGSGGSW